KLNIGDTLLFNDGVYQEKLVIWKDSITLKAKNPGKAILTNKDYYHKIMQDHNECNTFRTYTVYVGANHVTFEDLVIQNESTPSNIYGQAVALHVDGNDFLCKNCTISSAQDTLFTGPLPKDLLERYKGFYEGDKLRGNFSTQVYKDCKIIGDVDFIFGCAVALFENCDLITLDRKSKIPSYVCAPAHPMELPYGYLFYKCHFKGQGAAYLARPWRDYGCAAFIDCSLGNHIHPEGFNKWNDTNRDKTARFYEYTPKKDTSTRVSWSHQLTQAEAVEYVQKFKMFLKEKQHEFLTV
ncbi:MAG: hypothetical protein K2N65_04040, partial [Anaeroplasmataceae bacterium]|nr:hypothetical protein [Anaeroplasmataceae bacterium]